MNDQPTRKRSTFVPVTHNGSERRDTNRKRSVFADIAPVTFNVLTDLDRVGASEPERDADGPGSR